VCLHLSLTSFGEWFSYSIDVEDGAKAWERRAESVEGGAYRIRHMPGRLRTQPVVEVYTYVRISTVPGVPDPGLCTGVTNRSIR